MQEKQRLVFIDLLRGWALIVMIEVHVFNSLMQTQLKSAWWFPYLNFVNGLVAPSFLFISGFAFILASRSKLHQFKEYGTVFWRQVGRIFLIYIVGYSIHLPFLNIHKMTAIYNTPGWFDFLRVDVLQCIAVGLAILFMSRMVIKSEKNHLAFIMLLAAVFILAAPLMWLIDFSNYMPVFFANYINPKGGSLFPLFPWVGFTLCGAATAYFYLYAKENKRIPHFHKWLTISGIAMVIIGHITLLENSPFFIKMYRPNWLFFVLRIGYVFSLLSLCMYYEIKKNPKKSFVLEVSRESLLIYWLHLQVLFRKVWDETSIETIINYRFGVIECIVSTIALIVLMIYSAKLWGYVKKEHPVIAQRIFWGTFAGCVLIFYLA